MHKILRAAARLGLLTIALAAFDAAAQQYTWTDVPRIVAISDPHGAYQAMVRTLINAEVVDEEGNWSGGDTHLVVTGDLMDRGADSRKVMDFVMQLEAQAEAAGGKVHMLLGNHEVMNLIGDLRYVAPGEYAAFIEDESEEERERWFRIFVAQKLAIIKPDEEALRAEFNKTHLPGFFGHRQAFSAEGKYGKWLLEQPLMVVLNGNAFVHGGIPPLAAELGLEELNKTLVSHVADYVGALDELNEAGLMSPSVNFYRQAEMAESLSVMTTLSPEIRSALKTIIDLRYSDIHDVNGPLWYRGNVACTTLIESDRLTAALRAIGAERVFIGHTPTQTKEVLARLDGRVIEIDTGMLNVYYKGYGHAVVIENDELWVVSERSTDLTRVTEHPRRVGFRPGGMSESNLDYLLTHGEIVWTETHKAKRRVVEVMGENAVTVKAVFTKDDNRKGVNPELAAYRLDRLLNLDMVPVTVAREIDGEKGSLQFLPDNTRNEEYRSNSGSGGGAWCPLRDQWDAMYIFDALIYNPGRNQASMLYNLENWQLMLNNNSEAFGAKRGRPPYLKDAELAVNPSWKQALTSLDDAALEANFADVLDKRRIGALADRRDQLLEGGD